MPSTEIADTAIAPSHLQGCEKVERENLFGKINSPFHQVFHSNS